MTSRAEPISQNSQPPPASQSNDTQQPYGRGNERRSPRIAELQAKLAPPAPHPPSTTARKAEKRPLQQVQHDDPMDPMNLAGDPTKPFFPLQLMPFVPASLICSYLRKEGSCEDLANLRNVHPTIRASIDRYLDSPVNRIPLHSVELRKLSVGDGFIAFIRAFSSNLPMHRLHLLGDSLGRPQRVKEGSNKLCDMKVVLRDAGDATIEGLSKLMGERIGRVSVQGAWTDNDMEIVLATIKKLKRIDFLKFSNINPAGIIPSSLLSVIRQCAVSNVTIQCRPAEYRPRPATIDMGEWLNDLLILVKQACIRQDRQAAIQWNGILSKDRTYWSQMITERLNEGYRVHVNGQDMRGSDVNAFFSNNSLRSINLMK